MDAEELAALKAKYSSAQIRGSAASSSSHVPFSRPTPTAAAAADPVKTDAYNALDKYVVCATCQGSGTLRIPYNHRWLESSCDSCDGDGIVTTGAVLGTSTSHTATESSPPSCSSSAFDVVIVGGGLTGLSCAQRIVSHSPHLRVALVEARQVFGGRTCAEEVLDSGGGVLGMASVGGTWIGQKHAKMLKLAREVGLEIEEQFYPRRSNEDFSRLISLLSYSLKPLTGDETEQMNQFVTLLESIVSAVDISDIKKLPNALVYDSTSIREFVSSKVKAVTVRYEIMTFFESILSCDVSECSFLYAVWLIASSGGLEALGDNTPVSNQMYILQVPAGPAEICLRMAKRLQDAGITFFRASVNAVDYSTHDRVVLKTDHFELSCSRCVFAMNPILAFSTIHFDPKLPQEKKYLSRTFLKGNVIKAYLCYDEPFWGDGMYVADSISDDRDEDIEDIVSTADEAETIEIVDNSNQLAINQIFPAKNIFYCKKIGGYHSIVALITGKTCESILNKTVDERKQLLLEQLEVMYDNVDRDVIRKPVAYHEKNWCDDGLSGGCYSNGYKSFLNVQSTLKTSLDKRVFFASSETSVEFCGYMEGALLSGEAIADVILKSL